MNTGHILRGERTVSGEQKYPRYTVIVKTQWGGFIRKMKIVADTQEEAASKALDNLSWIDRDALRISVLNVYITPRKNYAKLPF